MQGQLSSACAKAARSGRPTARRRPCAGVIVGRMLGFIAAGASVVLYRCSNFAWVSCIPGLSSFHRAAREAWSGCGRGATCLAALRLEDVAVGQRVDGYVAGKLRKVIVEIGDPGSDSIEAVLEDYSGRNAMKLELREELTDLKVESVNLDKERVVVSCPDLRKIVAGRSLTRLRDLEVGATVDGEVVRFHKTAGVFVDIGCEQVAFLSSKDYTKFALGEYLEGLQVLDVDLDRQTIMLNLPDVWGFLEERKVPMDKLRKGDLVRGKVVKVDTDGVWLEICSDMLARLHEPMEHALKLRMFEDIDDLEVHEVKEKPERLREISVRLPGIDELVRYRTRLLVDPEELFGNDEDFTHSNMV